MAEAADSLHRDEIGGERTTVAQGVEGGDSGAKQGRGFRGIQRFGHGCQRLNGHDYVLGVTAVIADARNLQLFAISKVAAAAGNANAVPAAVPANTDTLAFFPD